MPSPKPHIAFHLARPPPASRPSSHARLAYLAAELLLTSCASFSILLGLLYFLGLVVPSASAAAVLNASPLGILRVTGACTLLVYFGLEGGAMVLHWVSRRHDRDYETDYGYEYEYDGKDLEGGAWETDGGQKTPFTMNPGRVEGARNGWVLCLCAASSAARLTNQFSGHEAPRIICPPINFGA
jgi:hypothetical protein